MGTVCNRQIYLLTPTRPQLQRVLTDMKFSALLICSLVFLATLPWVEAGCGQHGCCYCGTATGNVINDGRYRTTCHSGTSCDCGYDEVLRSYFGHCIYPGAKRLINAPAFIDPAIIDS